MKETEEEWETGEEEEEDKKKFRRRRRHSRTIIRMNKTKT